MAPSFGECPIGGHCIVVSLRHSADQVARYDFTIREQLAVRPLLEMDRPTHAGAAPRHGNDPYILLLVDEKRVFAIHRCLSGT